VTLPPAPATACRLHPRVRQHLDALVAACTREGHPPVSVALFGSSARGDFSEATSDVDLVVVLADGASREDRRRVRDVLTRLEVAHGFRPATTTGGLLARFLDRAGGNALSGFVCTRGELLAGDVATVLGLRPIEAALVDRIVWASIVASAVTAWGEDLVPRVPVPPVRRLDVLKALVGFTGQLLLSAAALPVLPDATRYALGALKRSVHSCYYCHHHRSAPLEVEVAFLRGRGADGVLADLLALRRAYRPSPGFVLRCVPAVLRLHLRTLREGRFTRDPPERAAASRVDAG
jgi:predicted nucleotidyltransferase